MFVVARYFIMVAKSRNSLTGFAHVQKYNKIQQNATQYNKTSKTVSFAVLQLF